MPRAARVSVVFDDQTRSTLVRLAAAQGRSVSALVAEVLREVEPGLRRAADLGEQFLALNERQRSSLREAVMAVDTELGLPLQEAMETARQVHDRMGQLVDLGDRLRRDRPPLGNTGVTLSDKGKQ